jgi:hypothetical protein
MGGAACQTPTANPAPAPKPQVRTYSGPVAISPADSFAMLAALAAVWHAWAGYHLCAGLRVVDATNVEETVRETLGMDTCDA